MNKRRCLRPELCQVTLAIDIHLSQKMALKPTSPPTAPRGPHRHLTDNLPTSTVFDRNKPLPYSPNLELRGEGTGTRGKSVMPRKEAEALRFLPSFRMDFFPRLRHFLFQFMSPARPSPGPSWACAGTHPVAVRVTK